MWWLEVFICVLGVYLLTGLLVWIVEPGERYRRIWVFLLYLFGWPYITWHNSHKKYWEFDLIKGIDFDRHVRDLETEEQKRDKD